jgi:hypothetical protein
VRRSLSSSSSPRCSSSGFNTRGGDWDSQCRCEDALRFERFECYPDTSLVVVQARSLIFNYGKFQLSSSQPQCVVDLDRPKVSLSINIFRCKSIMIIFFSFGFGFRLLFFYIISIRLGLYLNHGFRLTWFDQIILHEIIIIIIIIAMVMHVQRFLNCKLHIDSTNWLIRKQSRRERYQSITPIFHGTVY